MPDGNKRRIKIIAIAGVTLLVLLAGGAGFSVWWAYNATPGTAQDELQKLESKAIALSGTEAEGRKKWDQLQEIIAAWEATEHATAQYMSQPADWPSGIAFPHDFAQGTLDGLPVCVVEHHAKFAKTADERGLLDLIGAFGDPPSFIRPFTRDAKDIVDILLPDVAQARGIHELLVLQLRLAAEAGDAANVVKIARASMGFSRQMGQDPVLISYLNAEAMRTQTLHEMRRLICEHKMPAEAMKPLLEILSETQMLDPALGLDAERFFTSSMLRRVHTDDGHGDGTYLPHEFGVLFAKWNPQTPVPSPLANLRGLVAPSLKETHAHAMGIYDRYVAAAKLGPLARGAIPEPATDPATAKYPVLPMILPALSHVLNSHDMVVLEFASTRLMLAIELHAMTHGMVPMSLQELDPAIMATLPQDPWNGGAWGYRPLEPGTRPDGWTYLLYSRGKDGVDHGGVLNSNPPGAVAQPGQDWIVNLSREKWK